MLLSYTSFNIQSIIYIMYRTSCLTIYIIWYQSMIFNEEDGRCFKYFMNKMQTLKRDKPSVEYKLVKNWCWWTLFEINSCSNIKKQQLHFFASSQVLHTHTYILFSSIILNVKIPNSISPYFECVYLTKPVEISILIKKVCQTIFSSSLWLVI